MVIVVTSALQPGHHARTAFALRMTIRVSVSTVIFVVLDTTALLRLFLTPAYRCSTPQPARGEDQKSLKKLPINLKMPQARFC
jgi:hypothetical protein